MTPALAGMALLTLLAGLWLSRPWWSARNPETARRRAANVAAYRQRLAELEGEVEAGLVTPEAAAALRRELDARLLVDAAETGTPPSPQERKPLAALALVVVIAAAAAGGYYLQGSWRTEQLIAAGPQAQQSAQAAQIDQMVQQLAERLKAQPDDPDGWSMLGRAYFALGRYAESAQAYAKFNELTGEQNPDGLVNEGEALALAQERDLRGKPRELFDRALSITPEHGKGLWYAGLAAEQDGDPQSARARWTVLSRQELPQPLRAALDERLAQLGGPVAAAEAAPAATAASEAPAGAAAPVQLRIRLSLAPELAPKLPPGAVLYVFAKADGGPPMPLAVHRAPVTSFPAQIVLDDSMAMMPSLKLSQFDRWVVTARISTAGDVRARSGDLQGSRSVVRTEAGQVLSLTIDQVLP